MSLTPGAHLGPYEILSTLGAGGMGEVYGAHDAKLNRDVALKVLPDTFTRDSSVQRSANRSKSSLRDRMAR
jgi:serine/threonine protein kinase